MTWSPSITTVKFWAAEYKSDRKWLADDKSSGRPKIVITGDNITQVHLMLLNDCQIKLKKIAEAMKISKRRVCYILNQVGCRFC